MVRYMKNYTFPFNKKQENYRVVTIDEMRMLKRLKKLVNEHNYYEIQNMFMKLYSEKNECIELLNVMEEDIIDYKKKIDELRFKSSNIPMLSNTELLEAENKLLRKEVEYLRTFEIDEFSDLINKEITCPRCSYNFKKSTLSDCTFLSYEFEKMKTINGTITNLPVIDESSDDSFILYENITMNNNVETNNNIENFDINSSVTENTHIITKKSFQRLTPKAQKKRNMRFTDMLLKKNGGEKLHISTLHHIIKEMGHEKSFMPKISLEEIRDYVSHHKVSFRSINKIKKMIEDKLQYKMFPETKEIKEIWDMTTKDKIDDLKMNEIFKSVLGNLDSHENNQINLH
ncbi:Hypothetical protein SRAE_1000216300 [Strongyloides ratti]|uniref:Uncharacterized protein n=1 Tax=Strongyloides ratti TaxID=34506 RepID=A0A090L2I2_STRRB|nr:Hypothetical protein SRAE_1000216300 [Strongyloides ratti]CEF63907.1 Hypothetical protein SRAE_1000216300 [Strongyloides ratti]